MAEGLTTANAGYIIRIMLDSRRSSTLIALSKGAAVTTLAVGAVVMLGWALGMPALKSVLPDWVAMKSNTALCFILLGAGLLLANAYPRHAAFRFLAGFVALTGLLTVCEYVFGWNLHIDQLLFREAPGAIKTVSAGRMAPHTSLSFLLTGSALLLLDTRPWKGYQLSRILAAPALLLGMVTAIGYAYGVTEFEGVGHHTAMALNTALSFVIFSLGIISARPDRGVMSIVTSDRPWRNDSPNNASHHPVHSLRRGSVRRMGRKSQVVRRYRGNRHLRRAGHDRADCTYRCFGD